MSHPKASAPKRRITMKQKRPNPLFEQWLTEWRDKAQETESKMQYCFSKALESLQKYPLQLESGTDCKILQGFGEKLCKMLDDKLAKRRIENEGYDSVNLIDNEVEEKRTRRKSTTPKSKEYVPQYRSGAFAILLTMFEKSQEPNYGGFMSKSEIIQLGQHLSDTSFTKAPLNCHYTAWSSMKTLLDKKLVCREGNPARFILSTGGKVLGDKLFIQQKIMEIQEQENKANSLIVPFDEPTCSKWGQSEKVVKNSDSKGQKKGLKLNQETTSPVPLSNEEFQTEIFAPCSFDIVLLVDIQEINGPTDSNPFLHDLTKKNVQFEVRNLKVGDYLWIARNRMTKLELVLPYVIERKRVDDFAQSIKSGRYHEQKFRLKRCGCPKVIYLIESYGKNNEHVGLPMATLYQAATNTLIQDKFSVKFTEERKGTCEYLASLTKLITKLFKDKTLVSCPKDDLKKDVNLGDHLVSLMFFNEFNKSSVKNQPLKIKDMFVKQLVQVSGLSVDKALAIVQKYPTPYLLWTAYNDLDTEQREKLLSKIQFGPLKKNLGPVVSKIIYQLFHKIVY